MKWNILDILSKDDKNDSVESPLRNSERCQVELSGHTNCSEIKDYWGAVFKRLESIRRRLRREPEFHKRYATAISSYYSNDVAENDTTDNTSEHMAYNGTHRDVLRRHGTTTLVRVVFDASSRPKHPKQRASKATSKASDKTESSGEILQRRWKRSEQALRNLANRWRREHFQELRSVHVAKTRSKESVRIEDIELKELNSPRQLRKMEESQKNLRTATAKFVDAP